MAISSYETHTLPTLENYLDDKDFLLALDNYPTREVYVRVTALNKNEQPIEAVEGRATGGSINIDGASAVRRTCSLSLVTDKVDLTDYYWSLNCKFKLEIGLRNFMRDYPDIDHPEWSIYPEICWFQQGIYLITSFNASLNANSFTINIQGKDKMSQLNGDCGGTLTSSVDFGKLEYYDKETNTTTYEFIPIKDIIYNAVHLYGNELTHKIIINDLDIMGKQLMEYRGEDPMYILINKKTSEVVQVLFDGNIQMYICGEEDDTPSNTQVKISEIPVYSTGDNYIDTATQGFRTPTILAPSKTSVNRYVVQKVTFGQSAGYEEVPLTYASKDSKTELIGNVGETIVSILDKIKQMLGDYEYFYDLDGNFVFQKQKTYVNTSWADMLNNGDGIIIRDLAYGTPTVYDFYNSKLFTAITNNPKIDNIKNDYSVWGQKKTLSGATVPIHMRYAIDKKPEQYTNIIVTEQDVKDFLIMRYNILDADYFENNHKDGDAFVVQVNEDFVYKMKPQTKQCVYKALTPDMVKVQQAMSYLDEDTPELIELVRKPVYDDEGTKDQQEEKWQKLMSQRLKFAERNGWNEQAAKQYINLFLLWSFYFQDYAINTGVSAESQLSQALEKLLIPSKERLTSIELNLIKNNYKNNFDEDLLDFGYNAIDSNIKYVDWREIIYQMAKDYYQYNELDNFNRKIMEANGTLYPKGITGYERYYIDINGFWREQYWGWDEELEPTINDIDIQYVRQANRLLVKDEDIAVRSRMNPVLVKEILSEEFLLEQAQNEEYNLLLNKLYDNQMYRQLEIILDNDSTEAALQNAITKLETLEQQRLEKIKFLRKSASLAEQFNNIYNLLVNIKQSEENIFEKPSIMAEWSNLKKYGNGYNVNLPSNGSLIINVEWLNVYESDSGQWKISGTGNSNFEIEQTVIKDKIISIKIYRKSGNSTNYKFAISYYDKKNNQKDYIDLNITIVSAVNNSINKEDFLNRFKEFLYYRTILGQSADMPEEEWFYNYYVSTYKKTPNFKKFELEKDFDVESLRKNILILPEGIDHTKYYIYDHNEDDKYSSFIPWWQYEKEVQINFEDTLAKLNLLNTGDSDDSNPHFLSGEGHEGYSIEQLSKSMIKWIEDGGHCRDLMFLFLATLRRNKVRKASFSMFATRQFEDLFVLWDEHNSSEAHTFLKSYVENKKEYSDVTYNELKSQYRVTFFEEFLGLLVNTPEVVTLIDGNKTRPEAFLDVVYQLIAHLESGDSASTPIVKQILQEYLESGIFDNMAEYMTISNLATLWANWRAGQTGIYIKMGQQARQILIYGEMDEDIISEKEFKKKYSEIFDMDYDGTTYYQFTDSKLDYGDAMINYANEVVTWRVDWNHDEDTYTLKQDPNFRKLADSRMKKIKMYKYSVEAAQQFENTLLMLDFLNPPDGDTSNYIPDDKWAVIEYMRKPAKEKANSIPNVSGWKNLYKNNFGTDFTPSLATVDKWDHELSLVTTDYSSQMVDYITKDGHTKNDPEWIILAKKRENKVLDLNYSYEAAIQFRNLCELYMDIRSSSVSYKDILFGIIIGQFKNDEDVIKNRIKGA